MYYLQSRYYDPEVGRFLNADAYTSTGQGIIGSNMFAYCLCDPVNNTDPQGFFANNRTNKRYFFLIFVDMTGGGGGGLKGNGSLSEGLLLVSALVSLWDAIDLFFDNLKTEEEESSAVYYAVRIENKQWIQDSTPMTFDEAYGWVTSMAETHGVGFNSSWGLYTKNQEDAYEMIVALGGADPVWDKGAVGQYSHYHPYGRSLFAKYEHFHVWYGEKN